MAGLNEIQLIVTGDAVLAQMVTQSEAIAEAAAAAQKSYSEIKITSSTEITKFVADQKKYEEQIISFKKTIETLETELTKLKKSYEDNAKATEKSTSEYKKEAQTLAELGTEINSLQTANKTLSKNYEQNAVQIEQNKAKIKELKTEYTNLTKVQKENKDVSELLVKFNETQNLSITELKSLYSGLVKEYNNLTESERLNTEQGKKLTAQLSLISQKIKDGNEAVGNFRDSVGDYGRAITKNTEQLKDLLLQQNKLNSENKQGTQEYKDIQFAIIQTTAKIVKYRAEVEKVELQTKQLTTTNKANSLSFTDLFGAFTLSNLATKGADLLVTALQGLNEEIDKTNQLQEKLKSTLDISGSELDNVTIRIKTLTDVYENIDTETLSTSLNAVVKELGVSESEALTLIEEGFAKGSNANGEFLEILKEYPSQFSAAGISAEQTFAIINKSAKEGIYSDKGADAIKEALLRLRELTPATTEALLQIGFTSDEIKKGIKDGTLASFEGIQKVSEKLSQLDESAPQTGTALADIFGGAGEDAGFRYITMLKDVETNLNNVESTQSDLTKANLSFREQWNKLIVTLSSSEGAFSNLKAEVFDNLAAFLEAIQTNKELQNTFENYKEVFTDIFSLFGELFSIFGDGTDKVSAFEGIINVLSITTNIALTPIRALIFAIETIIEGIKKGVEFFQNFIDKIKGVVSESEFLSNIFDKIKTGIENLLQPFQFVVTQSKQFLATIGLISDEVESLLAKATTQTITNWRKVGKEVNTISDKLASDIETANETINGSNDVVATSLDDLNKAYKNSLQILDSTTDEEVEIIEEYKSDFENYAYAIIDLYTDINNATVESSQLTEEEIQNLTDNILSIQEILSEAAEAFIQYKQTEIQANIDAIEKKRTAIDKEIALEEERINSLSTNLETEKELRDNEQENNYLRGQSEIANSKALIAEKQKLSDELVAQQDKEKKKLAALKKAGIISELAAATVQISIDTALAISALSKNAAANPANIVNPLTQYLVFASGLVKILAAAALAGQQIKALKDGEIDIQGAGTETSDSIPARLSRGESVINAQQTEVFKPYLKLINKRGSTPKDLFSMNKDFGQKELQKYNIEIANSKFSDDKIISYLQKIVSNGETQTVVIDNTIVKISKNKIEKIKL
jgi:TP901 family phage tail tape measure protein